MKCPYPDCGKDGMIPPPKPYASNAYGYCKHCERSSRATIRESGSGKVYISYSATSLPRLHPDDVKKQHSVRWSENQRRDKLARGFKSMQDFIDRG